jgi:hypothetical protein
VTRIPALRKHHAIGGPTSLETTSGNFRSLVALLAFGDYDLTKHPSTCRPDPASSSESGAGAGEITCEMREAGASVIECWNGVAHSVFLAGEVYSAMAAIATRGREHLGP